MAANRHKFVAFEDSGFWRGWVEESVVRARRWLKWMWNVNIRRQWQSLEVKMGEEVILINLVQLRDYQVYEARPAICLGSVNKSKVKLRKRFSLFLGRRSELVNELTIAGYAIGSKGRQPFSFTLKKKYFSAIDRPSYWIDVKVPVRGENIFVTKIKVYEGRQAVSARRLFVAKARGNKFRSAAQPPVVIISLDAISASDIKYLPALAGLEKDGLGFKRAVASSSVTGGAAGCLISGLGVSRHLLYDYETKHYNPDLLTLSGGVVSLGELWSDAGYRTAALTVFSKWRPHYGYARGFDRYINVAGGSLQFYPYLQQAIRFIGGEKDGPAAVLLHLPGAHPPYRAVAGRLGRQGQLSAYRASLEDTNMLLQGLLGYLKEAGLYEKSCVIVVSDHGNSMYPFRRQSYPFKDERIKVPLVVKFPGGYDLREWKRQIFNPISATTSIYEMAAAVSGMELPTYYTEAARRKYGDIMWVNETVDYGSLKRIGLVGYNEYKWVVWCELDHRVRSIGRVIEAVPYRVDKFGGVDDNMPCSVSTSLIEAAKESARAYVQAGRAFVAERGGPVRQGEIRQTVVL